MNVERPPVNLHQRLERAETRSRIISMYRSGATAEQVADTLRAGDPERGIPPIEGITPEKVADLVKRYLERVRRQDALGLEELRTLENERLDALWLKLSQQLVDPASGQVNVKIVDRLTRISERRAKMNGLDAATKHEHFTGDPLKALGLDEEHIRRAAEAWEHVQSIEADVVVQEIGPARP